MSAPVVSGVAALVLQAHPDWTPDQVKWALVNSSRLLKSRLGEVNAAAVLAPASWRIPSANRGIAPNTLLDPATGDIDYTRSSWTRSSWTSAADGLNANWSRSSWTCLTCDAPDAEDGEASPVGSGIQSGGSHERQEGQAGALELDPLVLDDALGPVGRPLAAPSAVTRG